MKTIVEKINAGFEAFAKDAAAQVESGNKAAGARARKASLEIEKLLKEFRKESIAAAKEFRSPQQCATSVWRNRQ